ncbi:4'-phosphopantetheinyl transferase [Desulfosarcina variabilis str. Montpellier]|uniref:4'-phosphopantetheinyl transferase family protein n=1 Tax=Desulfosarcina variabilis TaxID=2300 RepID=UPI003AFA9D02
MTSPLITLYPVIAPVSQPDQDLKGREKVVRLSQLARLALQRSCRISGLRLDSLPKNEDGVPLPVDGVYWSISHKSEVVGGVAAPMPVGFDLEILRPINPALMDRVADIDEWGLVGSEQTQTTFFRFWTAKEAVLKAEGKGFAGLSRCRIAQIIDTTCMVLTFDDRRWPVSHFWFGDQVAAITSHHFAVDWQIVKALS